MERLLVKGLESSPPSVYNMGMKNATNNNGTTTRTPTRKGPKPIQTVAQLKENLLRDALAKEIKKIDRKIAVESRKRSAAQRRANDSTATLDRLAQIRADFLAESGLAPRA